MQVANHTCGYNVKSKNKQSELLEIPLIAEVYIMEVLNSE